MPSQYHTNIFPLDPEKDIILLQKKWLNIITDQHFFLSWYWINTWLTILPKNIKLHCVEVVDKNGDVVGLGLFHYKRSSLKNGFTKEIWIHRTGVEKIDQVWMEYNDFLTVNHDRKWITQLLLKAITGNFSPDTIHLQVCPQQTATRWSDNLPENYHAIFDEIENGGYCDFNKLTAYTIPSKSLRKQINQTTNHLHIQYPNIIFTKIDDPKEKQQLIDQTLSMHVKKWQNTTTPSGWGNSVFYDFHKKLIATPMKDNMSVEIFVLKNNDEILSLLYTLRQGDWLGFYLSHTPDLLDNKLRLGLYMHKQCIQWCIDNNIRYYDFMAGNARYKKQLSNINHKHGHLIIYKNSIKNALINFMKEMKSWW